MNAKEAKEISDKANLPDMEGIFSIIGACASTGATDCWIDDIKKNHVEYVRTKLQEFGYHIVEEDDTSPEDEGDYAFHISWENA